MTETFVGDATKVKNCDWTTASTKTYPSLEIERTGVLATIWMNRPQVFNAFDETLIADLTHACAALDADPGVRVLVLGGRGRHFSAGADLNWMKRASTCSQEETCRTRAGLLTCCANCRKCQNPLLHGSRAWHWGEELDWLRHATWPWPVVTPFFPRRKFALELFRQSLVRMSYGPSVRARLYATSKVQRVFRLTGHWQLGSSMKCDRQTNSMPGLPSWCKPLLSVGLWHRLQQRNL